MRIVRGTLSPQWLQTLRGPRRRSLAITGDPHASRPPAPGRRPARWRRTHRPRGSSNRRLPRPPRHPRRPLPARRLHGRPGAHHGHQAGRGLGQAGAGGQPRRRRRPDRRATRQGVAGRWLHAAGDQLRAGAKRRLVPGHGAALRPDQRLHPGHANDAGAGGVRGQSAAAGEDAPGVRGAGQARARKHSFGSGGANQTLHLFGAVFNDAAGLDMAHVPFKGDAQISTDIIGGHVSGGFVTVATAKPHIEAGTMRAPAVAGPRSPLLPGVPSFRELGYTQLDVVGWFGMFGPANMPKPVLDKIAADVAVVLKTPDVEQKLKDMSLTPTAPGPAEFGRIVKRDLGYWDAVMKKVGEK
ncbi:tripartite tricarboxylate transporter substrate binding protein [Ramlibacter terrae]|uniref:Tripartite tricarboxylate transporter substrate binding protein n=1 Tax=Ramlibacter terrae TaxID=2732511 RepID=A0ABX6P619_9BURK|nr:tripartite tricarboxylate transporter substrate binding protein [Ramlibacter terrae]